MTAQIKADGDGSVGGPPALLLAIVFCIFFFPAYMVLPPLGAAGTVPMILGLLLFLFWAASALYGLHDILDRPHPGRLAIGALVVTTLISYTALNAGWTGGSTNITRAGADRWLLTLAASAAIVLVAGATIRSIGDAVRYINAILAGATFCCVVAVFQFTFNVDPSRWISSAMIGFEENGGNTTFQARGALIRVAGTTFSPIELGVVASMLLPLSIWRLLYVEQGRRWLHAVTPCLLVLAIATTVSRSGVLGLIVALVTFLPFLPSEARRWVALASPLAVVALFFLVPGLIATLAAALNPEPDDPSITTRTDNWDRVAQMFVDRPWVGTGPGNYLPDDALYILDNQYLSTLVTTGGIGFVGLVVYLTVPSLTCANVAINSSEALVKSLAGAVAAGGAVAAVGSATFDSLSFPVFTLAYPALVGLGGALWNVWGKGRATSTNGQGTEPATNSEMADKVSMDMDTLTTSSKPQERFS